MQVSYGKYGRLATVLLVIAVAAMLLSPMSAVAAQASSIAPEPETKATYESEEPSYWWLATENFTSPLKLGLYTYKDVYSVGEEVDIIVTIGADLAMNARVLVYNETWTLWYDGYTDDTGTAVWYPSQPGNYTIIVKGEGAIPASKKITVTEVWVPPENKGRLYINETETDTNPLHEAYFEMPEAFQIVNETGVGVPYAKLYVYEAGSGALLAVYTADSEGWVTPDTYDGISGINFSNLGYDDVMDQVRYTDFYMIARQVDYVDSDSYNVHVSFDTLKVVLSSSEYHYGETVEGYVYTIHFPSVPIEGARVRLYAGDILVDETYTDVNGHFSFETAGIPIAPSYTVVADKELFNPGSDTFTLVTTKLTISGPSKAYTCSYAADDDVWIISTVDGSDIPPYVTVTVYVYDSSNFLLYTLPTTTYYDSDAGIYKKMLAWVPPEELNGTQIHFIARADNPLFLDSDPFYVDVYLDKLVIEGPEMLVINHEYVYIVEGLYCEEPVADVYVEIRAGSPDGPMVYHTYTNSFGMFSWTPDSTGYFYILAMKDGFEDADVKEVFVTTNALIIKGIYPNTTDTSHQFSYYFWDFYGWIQVTDLYGPIEGATVYVYDGDTLIAQGVTNSEGWVQFIFPRQPGVKTFTFIARMEGYPDSNPKYITFDYAQLKIKPLNVPYTDREITVGAGATVTWLAYVVSEDRVITVKGDGDPDAVIEDIAKINVFNETTTVVYDDTDGDGKIDTTFTNIGTYWVNGTTPVTAPSEIWTVNVVIPKLEVRGTPEDEALGFDHIAIVNVEKSWRVMIQDTESCPSPDADLWVKVYDETFAVIDTLTPTYSGGCWYFSYTFTAEGTYYFKAFGIGYLDSNYFQVTVIPAKLEVRAYPGEDYLDTEGHQVLFNQFYNWTVFLAGSSYSAPPDAGVYVEVYDSTMTLIDTVSADYNYTYLRWEFGYTFTALGTYYFVARSAYLPIEDSDPFEVVVKAGKLAIEGPTLLRPTVTYTWHVYEILTESDVTNYDIIVYMWVDPDTAVPIDHLVNVPDSTFSYSFGNYGNYAFKAFKEGYEESDFFNVTVAYETMSILGRDTIRYDPTTFNWDPEINGDYIYWKVVNSTGYGIEGVVVEIYKYVSGSWVSVGRAETNETGYFTIPLSYHDRTVVDEPGLYKFVPFKTGYYYPDGAFEFNAVISHLILEVNFHVPDNKVYLSAPVTGVVYDDLYHEFVEGAWVIAIFNGGDVYEGEIETGQVYAMVQTDSDGSFEITFDHLGNFTLFADGEGYITSNTVSLEVIEYPVPPTYTLAIEAPEYAILSGYYSYDYIYENDMPLMSAPYSVQEYPIFTVDVTDPDHPVVVPNADIEVRFMHLNDMEGYDGAIFAKGFTDDEGLALLSLPISYEFPLTGDYKICANKEFYTPATATFKVLEPLVFTPIPSTSFEVDEESLEPGIYYVFNSPSPDFYNPNTTLVDVIVIPEPPSQIDLLWDAVNNLEARLSTLEAAFQSFIPAIWNDLNATMEALSTLQGTVTDIEARLSTLESQVQWMNETKIPGIETELAALRMALEENVSALNNAITTINNAIQQLQNDVDTLFQAISDLQDALNENVTMLITAIQENKDELMTYISENITKLSNWLNENVSALSADISSLSSTVTNIQQNEIPTLQSNITTINNKLTELENRVNKNNQNIKAFGITAIVLAILALAVGAMSLVRVKK